MIFILRHPLIFFTLLRYRACGRIRFNFGTWSYRSPRPGVHHYRVYWDGKIFRSTMGMKPPADWICLPAYLDV